MRYLVVLLAACSPKPAPVQEEKKASIESFREPAQHLAKGMTAFVQGKDLEEAMKPWAANCAAIQEIRDQLKSKNASGAVLVAIEFEIYLMKDGKGVYSVRAGLYLGEKETSLMQYEAGESESSGALALEDLQGPFAGFGDAVRAILEGGDLPFADPKAVLKSAGWPAEAEKEISGLVTEGKTTYAAKRAEVAGLKYDRVRVEIDDVLLVAVDQDGKAVGAFQSQFVFENGKPAFQLNRLKG